MTKPSPGSYAIHATLAENKELRDTIKALEHELALTRTYVTRARQQRENLKIKLTGITHELRASKKRTVAAESEVRLLRKALVTHKDF